MTVEPVAPDRIEVRVARGREVLPGEDRPDVRERGLDAEDARRSVRKRRDVRQRLRRGAGTVVRVRNVVGDEARHAEVLPARSEIGEEADVLRRAGLAEVAAVADRKLDRDRRLELTEGGVVADAGELLVRGVRGELELRGSEPGSRPEEVRVLEQQGLERLPLLEVLRSRGALGWR